MDIHETIRNRRSIRAYLDKPIPEDVLERLQRALRFAPSACNLQPWHFVLVMEAGLRQRMAELAHGQRWIAGAPVIVVGCGLPQEAFKGMGGHGNSAEIDVAIALDHLTLAAAAEGLGTCWIGAFDEAGVKALLHVPARAQVVAFTPVGYPAPPEANRPLDETRRKPVDEIISIDRFGNQPEPA